MVGTATIGSPVVSATAFASPVAEPPPTLTNSVDVVVRGGRAGPLGHLDRHVHDDLACRTSDRDAGRDASARSASAARRRSP